jgi:phage protein D
MTGVTYALTVDDSAADAALLARLRRVEVEEHAQMADIMRLTFTTAMKADAGGWEVLDDDVFPRLAKARLTVTVGSSRSQPLFEGYVVEVRAAFSGDPTESTFEVVLFDPTVLMNLEEKQRIWVDMADSDIASTIFGDYGFTADVESTRVTRAEADANVMQRETDIQLLQRLARRSGFDCYVDVDAGSGQVTGHFRPPRYDDEPQGVISVGLGMESNIAALKVQHNLIRAAQAVANNLDAASAEAQPAEVTELGGAALGGSAALLADRPRRVLVNGADLSQTGELQTLAQAVTDRTALAISAEGTVNTQSYQGIIRAKRPILVRGAGRVWSGAYMVERVLHVFEGGDYTQTFTLRRNATGLAGREDFTTENE